MSLIANPTNSYDNSQFNTEINKTNTIPANESDRASYTEHYFTLLAGKTFDDESAPCEEKYVYDLLLAMEEGEPELFAERLQLSNDDPDYQNCLLRSCYLMGSTLLQRADKLGLDSTQQAQLEEELNAKLAAINDRLKGKAGELKLHSQGINHNAGLKISEYYEKEAATNKASEDGIWTKAAKATAVLFIGLVAVAAVKNMADQPRFSAPPVRTAPTCPNLGSFPPDLPPNDDLCQSERLSVYCEGNQGVPRSQMPQITDQVLTKFLDTLGEEGVAVTKETLPADSIKPWQSEQRESKILDMVKSSATGKQNICDRAIVIAGLDQPVVVDGHHGNTSCKMLGGEQRVTWIHMDPKAVFDKLKTFPGVTTAGL